MYENDSRSRKQNGKNWVSALVKVQWPRKEILDDLRHKTNNPDYSAINFRAEEILMITRNYGLTFDEIELSILTTEGKYQDEMRLALILAKNIAAKSK